jgi:hypothetical protein
MSRSTGSSVSRSAASSWCRSQHRIIPSPAGRNSPGAGRDHIQLVLTDRSPLTQGQDWSVLGTHSWRLADLAST